MRRLLRLPLTVASVVIEALGGATRLIRELAMRDVEGRFYAFKGQAIDVREDEDGQRWLRLDDVRKVLPNLPRTATLSQLLPQALARAPGSRVVLLSAHGLAHHLSRSEDARTLRFRLWLQRDVIFPAENARARRR